MQPLETWFCNTLLRHSPWVAYKFRSPGRRGVPDRLVIGPKGDHFFLEFKRPGERLTLRQRQEIQRLLLRQHAVYIVTTREQCDAIFAHHVAGRRHRRALAQARALTLGADGAGQDRHGAFRFL